MRFVLAFIFLISFVSFPARAGNSTAIPATRQQIQLSFAPLVKQVAPAVVNIYSKRVVTRQLSPFANDPFFQFFFGGRLDMGGLTRQQVESALGSGAIIDPEGLVVTNAHVVAEAGEITDRDQRHRIGLGPVLPGH